MANHICKWGDGWQSTSWASARGVWVKLTSEQEYQELRSWEDATCEDGRLLPVLWCELCQLAGDVATSVRPCKPKAPRSIK